MLHNETLMKPHKHDGNEIYRRNGPQKLTLDN